MKTLRLKLIFFLASLSAVVPQSYASIDLEGYWNYSITGNRYYYSTPPSQSGSYTSLGAGYYRYGYIDGGNIANNNWSGRSGSLALEFWSTNYYGGTTGYRLFTRGFGALSAGYYYPNVYKSGYFKSPGRYGYGKLFLMQYNYGWYTTDYISFGTYGYF